MAEAEAKEKLRVKEAKVKGASRSEAEIPPNAMHLLRESKE